MATCLLARSCHLLNAPQERQAEMAGAEKEILECRIDERARAEGEM